MITDKDETLSMAYLAYQEAISGDSSAAELHLWDAMRRHRAAVHAVLDRQRGRDIAKDAYGNVKGTAACAHRRTRLWPHQCPGVIPSDFPLLYCIGASSRL